MKDLFQKYREIILYLFFGVMTTAVGWVVYFAVLWALKAIMGIPVDDTTSGRYIGAYTAAMNGIDCLVFTAGIGENNVQVREMICEDMQFFGIEIDKEKNAVRNNGEIRDITGKDAKIKVLIIPTNEELVIARETVELL